MRRHMLGVVVAVFALAGFAAAQAATQATRTTSCHRTSSATKPYVKLTVTKSVLQGHLRHPADIIPAPAGGCPRVVLSPTRGGQALTTSLSGSNEVPAGDPDGTGTATIRLQL